MDWDKLKTFHFAAETGSLTHAADKLGVSQSAVSRQIAALEERIGVPLFQRHARGLMLTGPGTALKILTDDMAAVAAKAESALNDARTMSRPRRLDHDQLRAGFVHEEAM